MSYQELPDARPLSVKYVLGPLPRGIAMTLMFVFVGVSLAGLVTLFVNREHLIAWGGLTIITGLLAVQYFIAIRWADSQKTWRRRRTYRKHRTTHT